MIETYGPIFVGVAALAGGIKLLSHAILTIKLAKGNANSWPKADGKVLKSSYNMSNFNSPKSKNKESNTYMLDFEYEYFVDGTKYISTKPLFFNLYLINDIESFLDRYPKDEKISVYYNPNRYEQAVVETTLYGKSGSHEISFGVILIILSMIMFAIRYETIFQWIK